MGPTSGCNDSCMHEIGLSSGVEGVRCIPDEHGGVGALVLAGSSGRVDTHRARVLSNAGALAESVRWFGGQGQHAGPWEIALELFLERVCDLRKECDRVLVLGTSFGAEAALLTGAESHHVDAVVAFAPSDVVWAGITDDDRLTSHWTREGTALPFVPFVSDWQPTEDPPAFVDLYASSRASFPGEVDAARIAVERIPQVVLVAGGDDRVWPSVEQAQQIRERRTAHGLDTTLIEEADAGHRTILPGEPMVSGGTRMQRGGTELADRRLGEKAWNHIATLLR